MLGRTTRTWRLSLIARGMEGFCETPATSGLLPYMRQAIRSTSKALLNRGQRWQRSQEIREILRHRNDSLHRPDFLIIGAPKCATSWLSGLLAQHPKIFMVPEEIEYFSAHLDRPVTWYTAHFWPERLGMTDSDGVGCLVGEKSARYCAMSRNSIRLLRRLLPEVRLILMIRDPVARHWAHAKRHFSKARHGNMKDGSFVNSPELYNFFRRSQCFGEFSRMIENWLDVYPSERLLVLRQEEALENPRMVFDKVLQHLGASADYDPSSLTLLTKCKNKGPMLPIPKDIEEFLEEMFADERERLRVMAT
jgi:Sulfotransferase domain